MQEISTHLIFTRGLVLAKNSIHGLSHWQRVERLGLVIAKKNGADKEIVSLFAYLHDARRENEGNDPEHGQRAAILLRELTRAGVVKISKQQQKQLVEALKCHNLDNAESSDITIRTCWDADRLDLWRVGITPNPDLMFTEYGKSKQMINFSKKLFENKI